MSMAHAAWAVTGKFESQSPGDEVQEQLVAATKAQVPKNLPPSLYFTTMLLASLTGMYLWVLRMFAVPAFLGKPARTTRDTIRSQISGEVQLLIGLFKRAGIATPSAVERDPNFSAVAATAAAVQLRLTSARACRLRTERIFRRGAGVCRGLTVIASSKLAQEACNPSFGVGAALLAVHVLMAGTEDTAALSAAAASSMDAELAQADKARALDEVRLQCARLEYFENHKGVDASQFTRLVYEGSLNLVTLRETVHWGAHPVNGLVIQGDPVLWPHLVDHMIVGLRQQGEEAIGALPAEEMLPVLNQTLHLNLSDDTAVTLMLFDLHLLTLDEVMASAGIIVPTNCELTLEMWLPDSVVSKTACPAPAPKSEAQSSTSTDAAMPSEQECKRDTATQAAARAAADFYGDHSGSVMAIFIAAKASKRALMREVRQHVKLSAACAAPVTSSDLGIVHAYNELPLCKDTPHFAALQQRLHRRRPTDWFAKQVIAGLKKVPVLVKTTSAQPHAEVLEPLDEAAKAEAARRTAQVDELAQQVPALLKKRQAACDEMVSVMDNMAQANSRIIKLVHLARHSHVNANLDSARSEAEGYSAEESCLATARAKFESIELELRQIAVKQTALLNRHTTPCASSSGSSGSQRAGACSRSSGLQGGAQGEDTEEFLLEFEQVKLLRLGGKPLGANGLRQHLHEHGKHDLAIVRQQDLPEQTPTTGDAKKEAVLLLLRRRLTFARIEARHAHEVSSFPGEGNDAHDSGGAGPMGLLGDVMDATEQEGGHMDDEYEDDFGSDTGADMCRSTRSVPLIDPISAID